MKKLLIAGAMLALMTAPAFAGGNYGCEENCGQQGGGTNVSNTQLQGQQQQQQQSLTNTNTANGGAGGAGGQGGQGGAGGQGGTGYGGAASATGGSASSSASSNSSSNSGGNNFTVNDNQKLQAPAVSSFIAASGPCSGASGGGVISVAGFGLGASYASLETDCQKRELLRIGFSSGNASVEAQAAQGWQQMYSAAFGAPAGQSQSSATGQAPAAIAPEQTAQAQPYCNANWPAVIKLANHCN